MQVNIKRPVSVLKAKITLPASKSISNRAIILDFLAGNPIKLFNLSEAADTLLLRNILDLLEKKDSSGFIVDAGDAGTVMRFLTAMFAIKGVSCIITGSDRMKQRPIGPLVNALHQLNCRVEYLENDGFPPLKLEKPGSFPDAEVSVDGSVSSQFISALMVSAPLLGKLKIRVTSSVASWPYIGLTAGVMRHFGYPVTIKDKEITIEKGEAFMSSYTIEPDWSSASFWVQGALLAPDPKIILKDLDPVSIQGDSKLIEIGLLMGLNIEETGEGLKITRQDEGSSSFSFDFRNYPDLALPIVLACSVNRMNCQFTGLENLAFKESDRLSALMEITSQLGARLSREDDIFNLRPGQSALPKKIKINGKNDHRVIMSAAMLAVAGIEVDIDNAGHVDKSYPSFWKDLEQAGFIIKGDMQVF